MPEYWLMKNAELTEPYLTFSSPSSFTLKTYNGAKSWDGTLEYSTDTSSWTTWDGKATLDSGENSSESVLYLRGKGNSKITGSQNCRWVLTGSDIACSGNIETLLDYETVESGEHPAMANSCYTSMFANCTSLTTAPVLPATTLTKQCYYWMFYGCTSLTTAPALSAATLAYQCYIGMFYDCKGLTQAPALPATTLAESCYEYMFKGCTSLTSVPALPATTLAPRCYFEMFHGCASLKFSKTQTEEYTQEYRVPISGTGKTAYNALYSMFMATGGTFTRDPAINTTYYLSSTNTIVGVTNDTPETPENNSYLTFSSPSGFTLKVNDATKHWDGTLEYSTNASAWSTWNGTNTLSSAMSGSDNVLYLRGTGNTVITGDNSNYKWVLTGSDVACIGNIENLLDYATVQAGNHPTMASNCYRSMFYGCTSLTTAPALPATTLTDYCYTSMFQGCKSLTTAPALPATTLTDSCYTNMFYNCTSLTAAPALPATTLYQYCYTSMFQGCTSLTTAPALPATTLAYCCYNSMFYDCTSLTTAPALPATTLTDYCYTNMFYDCTSLTTAPALPATTLTDYCYFYMFYDCHSLKLSTTQTGEYTQAYRVPTSGDGTTADSALSYMFTGTGGTFKSTPTLNTTYYLSNTNTVV